MGDFKLFFSGAMSDICIYVPYICAVVLYIYIIVSFIPRRGPTWRIFAGCIQSMRTSIGSDDMALVPLDIPNHVMDSESVHLDQCYADVRYLLFCW